MVRRDRGRSETRVIFFIPDEPGAHVTARCDDDGFMCWANSEPDADLKDHAAAIAKQFDVTRSQV